MEEIKIYYNVQNCGDGSVYVNFHADKNTALKEEENDDERWAESSVSDLSLKL